MTDTTTHHAARRSVFIPGLIATVVAAAVNVAIAAAAIAAGVEFIDPKMPDKPIPLSGFAVLTVGFSLLGVVLAVVLSRVSQHPRRIFVTTTLVLLALSLVPDLTDVMVDWPTAAKYTLVLTHMAAAAIVIPTLARRLNP